MLLQRVFDGAAGLRFQRLLAPRWEMRDLHRIAAAGAGQPRRVQELCQAFAVQRRRHHHDAQVLAYLRLHVQRQRQAQVGSQVAFVEFVEQQRADAVEHRVVLEHPGQDALGDHLDAGARGHLVLEADAVAHGLARRFAALPGHERGGAARGDPARLQHHDAAALQPRRLQQRRRHLGGLAGAGRGFQHQPRVRGEAVADLRQQRVDRKNGRGHRPRIRIGCAAVERARLAGSAGPVQSSAFLPGFLGISA